MALRKALRHPQAEITRAGTYVEQDLLRLRFPATDRSVKIGNDALVGRVIG